MQASVLVLFLLPLAVYCVPCTDSTTAEPEPTTPEPTTEYVPPPFKFPQGTYGVPRPDVGCPLATGFKTFYRYWDTEDFYNANQWPSDEHFMGFMKKDGYKMYFCIKTDEGKGKGEWPAGDYCIIKKGDCPTGFEEGSIFWDDENTENQNAVTKNTKLRPDGVFDENTQLDFCCRNDGSADIAIKLPIRRAFYLMRYEGECQKVAEMSVTEESVKWDDEDTGNSNTKSGSHPYDSGSSTDHKLHFCYYEPQV